jgi:hypothetical protein
MVFNHNKGQNSNIIRPHERLENQVKVKYLGTTATSENYVQENNHIRLISRMLAAIKVTNFIFPSLI